MENRPAVDPKRTGLPAKAVAFDEDAVGNYVEPGTVELILGGSVLLLACPGCGWLSGMRVGNPKPEKSPSWEMRGGVPLLTLTPSINCIGCCGRHGFLTDGVFRSV